MEIRNIETNVLIIGGGTAGCFAAYTIAKESRLNVIIAEKANIKRSGCLAAGVNAINAYITEGQTPESYVSYAKKDACGIVREDLLLSAAQLFNYCTRQMEQLGLVIQKDESGHYAARGNRNIRINGENFKPLLAGALKDHEKISVINHLNITDLIADERQVYGAVGFSVRENAAYVIRADNVLIATGGAAGLYKPNNPLFSRHKMWYPPFNTGAGYAMAMKAGAEMTTLEMRFVALRCKDTIAPTGTIAQGVGAGQVNGAGKEYGSRYGFTTSQRIYGTLREQREGRGPCFLKTTGIGKAENRELLKAYLNMAPAQTLKWIESGAGPMDRDVEICGSEPYVNGGHTAGGIWVNTHRESTIKGLYAAGDVTGGCPQKYVTGALAEGRIAALDIISKSGNGSGQNKSFSAETFKNKAASIVLEYENSLISAGSNEQQGAFTVDDLEEAMQKIMDEYAGGISADYAFNERQLSIAEERLRTIEDLAAGLSGRDMHELLFIYELKERLLTARALIAHLRARKETRWHVFAENLDHPEKDKAYECYINSVLSGDKIKTFKRRLVKEKCYEHPDK